MKMIRHRPRLANLGIYYIFSVTLFKKKAFILNSKNIPQYYFYLIFDHINAGLEQKRLLNASVYENELTTQSSKL